MSRAAGWLGPRALSAATAGLLASAIWLSVPWDADPGWWDASRHAMNGAFYLDLISAGPSAWFAPLDFAKAYYSQYPAIAPALYPPGFSLLEAALFALFGVHVWVARLAVAVCLAAGAYGAARLVEELGEPRAGPLAAALTLSLPQLVYWGREVMLEPAAVALAVWALVFWRRFLSSDRSAHLAVALALGVAAAYTKQNFALILPVMLLSAPLAGEWRRLLDRRVLAGGLLVVLSGLPLVFVTLRFGALNLAQAFSQLEGDRMPLVDHLLYHLRLLPGTVGWPLLALSVVGSARLLGAARGAGAEARRNLAVGAAWLLFGYAAVSAILKEPRHGLLWLPVFACAAALGLRGIAMRIPGRAVGAASAVLICLALFAFGLDRSQRWCEGLDVAARHLARDWQGEALLTSARWDGALVFRMRTLDPERRFRVYRSSKIFESGMIHRRFGRESRVEGAAEIRDALSRYGIRYLLVDRLPLHPSEVDTLLRETVRGPEFERAAEFDTSCPAFPPGGGPLQPLAVPLDLYRFLGELRDPPERPSIHLPVSDLVIEAPR